jgi:hypothetical protein
MTNVSQHMPKRWGIFWRSMGRELLAPPIDHRSWRALGSDSPALPTPEMSTFILCSRIPVGRR